MKGLRDSTLEGQLQYSALEGKEELIIALVLEGRKTRKRLVLVMGDGRVVDLSPSLELERRTGKREARKEEMFFHFLLVVAAWLRKVVKEEGFP